MARNGSGTYNLPAGNPVTTGTTISSTWANSTLNDMATALTGSVAADGQTTPSANLPMGGFAHTNVGNATVRNMYPSSGQVQDGVITNLTSVAGTNTITAVGAVGMTAYATGQKFTFVSAGANTGAATLNINSIGAKAITKNGTTALVSGDIPLNAAIEVFYDGTQFQLLNPFAKVNTFSAGTTGLTPSTSTTGDVTLAGTLAIANGGTGSTSFTQNAVIIGNGTGTPTNVLPSTNGNVLSSTVGATVTAGSFVVGTQYTILTVGTTSFTAIGASANTVGVVFTATGVGSGTGTATTNVWASTTAPAPAALSTATGSAPSYSARAWVNFNGTGTVAIQGSGNIASVTDDGVGLYTITFTTAMPDANYAVFANCNTTSTNHNSSVNIGATYTATQFSIRVLETALVDRSIITVVVFR